MKSNLISFLFFASAFWLVGCGYNKHYVNERGMVRPTYPKYTIDDTEDLREFDSIPFVIKWAFDNRVEVADSEVIRDVMLFSEDGRFASYPLKWEEDNSLTIEGDPWQSGAFVGFYEIKVDTVFVEFFSNFSWGSYYTIEGIIEGDEMKIVSFWQGKGSVKNKQKLPPYRKSFQRVKDVTVNF